MMKPLSVCEWEPSAMKFLDSGLTLQAYGFLQTADYLL